MLWSTSRASSSVSRRRRRRWSCPTSTRRSTRLPPRPSFGTPSSRSANGGPSCRPTSSSRGARALLRVPRPPVERLDVVGHRVHRPCCHARMPGARLARAAAATCPRAAGRRRRVPAVLRGAQLGGARVADHPLGRRVLRLARPDEGDRDEASARLQRLLVRLSDPRRAERRESGPARPDVLLALPGGGGALPAAAASDVAADDPVLRCYARPRRMEESRRPPRPPPPCARLPARERGPDLDTTPPRC